MKTNYGNQLEFNSCTPIKFENEDTNYYYHMQKENPNIDFLNQYDEQKLNEQLDYINYNYEEFYKQQNANPLIYQNLNERYLKARSKSKNKRKSLRPAKKKLYISKNLNSKKPTTANTKNSHSNAKDSKIAKNQQPEGSGINNLLNKGLFDPGLKKNELGLERRTNLQKQQRLEKIKSYDLKNGIKTKSFQMYTNPIDMIEGNFCFNKCKI